MRLQIKICLSNIDIKVNGLTISTHGDFEFLTIHDSPHTIHEFVCQRVHQFLSGTSLPPLKMRESDFIGIKTFGELGKQINTFCKNNRPTYHRKYKTLYRSEIYDDSFFVIKAKIVED